MLFYIDRMLYLRIDESPYIRYGCAGDASATVAGDSER
jgi:hypothetical protein